MLIRSQRGFFFDSEIIAARQVTKNVRGFTQFSKDLKFAVAVIKENWWAFVDFAKSHQEGCRICNREIHFIFSVAMLINFVNPGYQAFSCFPMVTASLWVCQRHLYTIPATLQTVRKVLQRLGRKALQVSLHRYEYSGHCLVHLCCLSTHKHTCTHLPFLSTLHQVKADRIKCLFPLSPASLVSVIPGVAWMCSQTYFNKAFSVWVL